MNMEESQMHRYSTFIAIILTTLLLTACKPESSLLEMDEWDLVWISDSSGWGVAEVYAQMVEEDVGVQVNLFDNWIGALPAGEVLRVLNGGPTASYTLEQLAEQIKEAEIIVFYANAEQSIDENFPGDWHCIPGAKPYVNSCPDFQIYVQDLQQIYQKIFELREGQPTIVRVYDAYNPLIAKFHEFGVYEDCKSCWLAYNDAIHRAASPFGIPVAKVLEAWNGPEFDQDPVALGYTSDGIHPSEVGAERIAEAIRILGYEPVSP